MSRETPESASSKKEAEKISVNREASGHDTEANRSGREREKEENEENEEKQRLEKEEMEVRAADERKMDELRGNIEKMDGNLPLYRKDGRVCMPGWNIEEKGDENGKKMEETSEEGSKSGEGVETAIPDDKKEASGDTGKSDAGEANGNKDEEKGPEKIVPEEIGSDEAEKENIEKIVPEEIEKDKEEKADAEVKTDDTKEKKDEKPKTGPERETEKEPGLSDLKGEIDYTIRTAEKKKLESMTGEPDKEVKQEKKEDKETLKAEEVETTPDNGSSPEEKPETERVKTAAREKMIIPESKSSKFRKETTKEIDGLWETVRTGGDKEKKRAYDLILELGGPQMVATGSDEMFKATKMTEMAVASGNLYEMYIAARMSEAAVNTLSTAMGAQIEMTKATTEQKKLLNRIINGGSVGFSEWVDKRGKQPEVGTFTHNLNNSQENNLWQAVMRKDKKNSEKALRILLDKTNRAKEYPGISKDYQMESIIHDGRMHFDITWKDEDGKEHNLHYMLDGTALGEKAYKPSLKNYIHPMKKYPTVFTIAEGVRGGEAENPAQPETAASGNAARPEGNQTEVSKEAVKKYPKNAAFIADFRELYEGQDDSLKAIDRLENRLIGGKVGKAKLFLDKFIFSAEEDIKTLESELEGMEGKDKKKQKEFFEKMKELLKKAKDARRELDKEKEDRKEKPEGDEHPDVLAMKDLEPGDVAIVRVNIKGKEEKRRYYMKDDGAIYMNRGNSTNLGKLGSDPIVDKNVIMKKDVNGVVDIEIIKGEKEKKKEQSEKDEKDMKELSDMLKKGQYALALKRAEGGDVSAEVLELEEIWSSVEKGLKEAIDNGNARQISRFMEAFHLPQSSLQEEEIQESGKEAVLELINNDKYESAKDIAEVLEIPREFIASREVMELIEKRIEERKEMSGSDDGEHIRKIFGMEKPREKENPIILDHLNGSDIKEGDEFVIYTDTGEKFRLWRKDGMHVETMNALAYREYRLDDDYLLTVGKECAVPIEGTIKIADQSKLKENQVAVPMRQAFLLGRIEKIESLKEDKK